MRWPCWDPYCNLHNKLSTREFLVHCGACVVIFVTTLAAIIASEIHRTGGFRPWEALEPMLIILLARERVDDLVLTVTICWTVAVLCAGAAAAHLIGDMLMLDAVCCAGTSGLSLCIAWLATGAREYLWAGLIVLMSGTMFWMIRAYFKLMRRHDKPKYS